MRRYPAPLGEKPGCSPGGEACPSATTKDTPPRRTGNAHWGSNMAIDWSMPVLVVDDHGPTICILRNLLKQIGFEDIDAAADGAAALAKMRDKTYGLVIADWNSAPMTGHELLQTIRADPALAKTPFIMVTPETRTENVIAATQAGVDGCILKPFNARTLLNKIEAVFDGTPRSESTSPAGDSGAITTQDVASPPLAARPPRRTCPQAPHDRLSPDRPVRLRECRR